jgi:predicted nucleic acid-binding protein
MSLFVYTSVWYAAAGQADVSNGRAKAVLAAGEVLVTIDHVLVEGWSLLHHRLGKRRAERFWQRLRSGVAAIEIVNAADSADRVGDRYALARPGLLSCRSNGFAVMRRLGL